MLFYLRQGLSLSLSILLGCPRHPPASTSPALGLQELLHEFWESEHRPSRWTASTSSTKPSKSAASGSALSWPQESTRAAEEPLPFSSCCMNKHLPWEGRRGTGNVSSLGALCIFPQKVSKLCKWNPTQFRNRTISTCTINNFLFGE